MSTDTQRARMSDAEIAAIRAAIEDYVYAVENGEPRRHLERELIGLMYHDVPRLLDELAGAREVLREIDDFSRQKIDYGIDRNGIEWMPAVYYRNVLRHVDAYMHSTTPGTGDE